MTVPGRQRWLQGELMLRLMVPLLAIVVVAGLLGVWGARQLTDDVFDRWLIDGARGLSGLVRVEANDVAVTLTPQAEHMLLYDDVDETWFSVQAAGRLVSGTLGLPDEGEREVSYPRGTAFDASFGGHPVRVARVPVEIGDRVVTVLVAETLRKRERAQHQLLALLWPLALLPLAAAGIIVVTVRQTVRLLQAIAARWTQESHASLQPVGTQDVPRELLPFAAALDELLLRIRSMLARERQFAAVAAHQLRTPLAGLQLGLARAMESTDLDSTRAVLHELSGVTQRAARTVQQLLVLGKLDPEARGDLDRQATALDALVQDVGAAHAETAVAKGVELEFVEAPVPVSVVIQPGLVAEALGNLLDNAIQYTPTGGRVEVSIAVDPPALRVRDSGTGIDPDERAQVLQRFVRGRRSRGDGTGLGLAIAREIAELHGGRLYLEGNAWGGTDAVLELARAAPPVRV